MPGLPDSAYRVFSLYRRGLGWGERGVARVGGGEGEGEGWQLVLAPACVRTVRAVDGQ